MDKLLEMLQAQLAQNFDHKVDLYREEGKGVLAVPSGMPLHPANVIFSMNDATLSTLVFY